MGAWGLSGAAQRHPPTCPAFHSAGAPIRPLTVSLSTSSLPGPRPPWATLPHEPRLGGSLRPPLPSQWVLELGWVWEPRLSSETLAPHIACVVVGTLWQVVRLAPRAGHPGTWSVPHKAGSRPGTCRPALVDPWASLRGDQETA